MATLCLALIIIDVVFAVGSKANWADRSQSPSLKPHLLFQAIVEALMIMVLLAEVLFGWIAIGKCSCRAYMSPWSARLDVFVLTLSVLFYLVLYSGLSQMWKTIGIADVVFLVVRNGIQVLRLFIFIQRSKNSRQLAAQSDVDFQQLELSGAVEYGGDMDDSVNDISLGFDEHPDGGGIEVLKEDPIPFVPKVSAIATRVQQNKAAQKQKHDAKRILDAQKSSQVLSPKSDDLQEGDNLIH